MAQRGASSPLVGAGESMRAVYSSVQLYIFPVGFIVEKKAFQKDHFFLKDLGWGWGGGGLNQFQVFY